MRRALLVVVIVMTGCGSSSTAAHVTPSAGSTASASGTAGTSSSPSSGTLPTPTPSATSSPASGGSLVHCTAGVPPGDNMVIATVTGSSAIVVRDIQDIAHPRTLCTFDAGAQNPKFVSGSQVAYQTAAGQIVKADLAGAGTAVVATGAAGFLSAQYSFSADGNSVTYMANMAWHLANASGDHVLTTLPDVPGRGVNPDQDDVFLSFSPDGLYIALFQTFATGGTGATAPDQVRRATDGSLVYSATGMTMAVWASVPSRLFFRDAGGSMQRWDPASGVSAMLALNWIGPQSSPDGRWIAYTFRTGTSAIGGVGFYSVQANSVINTSPPGRAGVRFLNNLLVWYIGVRACDTCFGGLPAPTGTTYIYDIGGASETASRITAMYDAWPHITAPTL
jgi:hypothetical protein